MVKRVAIFLAWACLSGCNGLDPAVLYRCEAPGDCLQAGFSCWADGFCHPTSEPADGSTGGGGATGGGGGGGATGGGTGGGTATCDCPAVACGFFDAGPGCATLDCGLCAAGTECGVSRLNRCDTPRLCMNDGWCFENPLPQGNTLRGAWAIDGRAAWLVGDNATLLRWTGEHHEVVPLAALDDGTDLLAVHGTGPDNVFVVGTQGTVLHFDGATWTRESLDFNLPRPLRGVWAFADGGALAVGRGLDLYRRRATGVWASQNTTFGPMDFNDVAQLGDRALAVGDYAPLAGLTGAIAFENPDGGNTWVTVRKLPLATANSVWVSPDGGLFVVGATDAGTGSVVRQQADGGFTEVLQVARPLRVIRGRTSDDYDVAGELGLAAHVVDGGARVVNGPGTWFAVALLDRGALLEGRQGHAAFFVDAPVALRVISGGTRGRINALCSTNNGSLFAASEGTAGCVGAGCTSALLERNASGKWTETLLALTSSGEFTGCASLFDFRWLSGDGANLLVHDTNAWSMITGPAQSATGVWMSSASKGWVTNSDRPTGTLPFVTRLSTALGRQATPVPYDGGGDLITSVGGVGDVGFAVGEAGLLFSLTNGVMADQARLGTDDLRAVSGASLDDGGVVIVIAGRSGARYRLEGAPVPANFVAEPEPDLDFFAVATVSQQAFAVGADMPDGGRRTSRVSRRVAGGSWVTLPFLGDQPLRAVHALPTADGGVRVWVSGPGGVIERRDP